MIRQLLPILFAFPLLTLAMETNQQKECSGNWSIQLEPNMIEYRRQGVVSAWLPGYVDVKGALRHCAQQLALTPQNASSILLTNNGHKLEGQLYDHSYRNLVKGKEGNHMLTLSPTGRTQFWLRLPTAGFSPVGRYNGRLDAELIGTPSTQKRRVELTYLAEPVLSLKVPTTAQSWLTQSGHHYRVDLGEMTHGVSRDIRLEIRSNASITISIESKLGKLKHRSMPGQFIDYTLRMNGHSWHPSTPFTRSLGALASNRYTPVPFGIEVSPQPMAFAGDYSDQLSITIKAH